jgi:hypothetical protein
MTAVRSLVIVALLATGARAEPTGFWVATGGGTNVGTPFVEARVGRRFTRAEHFAIYADYSYDRAISMFSFQTFGIGVHSYLFAFADGRLEMFHQATAGFAVSSSGAGPVQGRMLGERLLGPVFTQGLGVEAHVDACWAAAFVVSIGDPVWLRPELSVKYTF